MPLGASGSSTKSIRLLASFGISVKMSGGLTSEPSHVNFEGIAWSFVKAELEIVMMGLIVAFLCDAIFNVTWGIITPATMRRIRHVRKRKIIHFTILFNQINSLYTIVSGERESNPRPLPWQGSVLSLNYPRINADYIKLRNKHQ